MNSEPSAGGRSVIRVSSVIIVHLYAGLNTERAYKKLIHAPSVFVVVIICVFIYVQGIFTGKGLYPGGLISGIIRLQMDGPTSEGA